MSGIGSRWRHMLSRDLSSLKGLGTSCTAPAQSSSSALWWRHCRLKGGQIEQLCGYVIKLLFLNPNSYMQIVATYHATPCGKPVMWTTCHAVFMAIEMHTCAPSPPPRSVCNILIITWTALRCISNKYLSAWSWFQLGCIINRLLAAVFMCESGFKQCCLALLFRYSYTEVSRLAHKLMILWKTSVASALLV